MNFSQVCNKIENIETIVEEILENIDGKSTNFLAIGPLNIKDFSKVRIILDAIKSHILHELFLGIVDVSSTRDVINIKTSSEFHRLTHELKTCLDVLNEAIRKWHKVCEMKDEMLINANGLSRTEIEVFLSWLKKEGFIFLEQFSVIKMQINEIQQIFRSFTVNGHSNDEKSQVKCPITSDICNKPLSIEVGEVFVGLQFNSEYYNTPNFKEVITESLASCGLTPFFADEHFEPVHISCEICHKLQEVHLAIFEISDSNPNVMFELGLAFMLGRTAILLAKHDSRGTKVSDIAGFHRIQYGDLIDCRRLLIKYLADSKVIKDCLIDKGGVADGASCS